MKLEKWALTAEIVSGVAVVVTLVFLILGIRENTEVTRSLVYDRNMDSMNEMRGYVVQDPEIAKLWGVYVFGDIDDLNDEDVPRIAFLIDIMFGNYEKAYFSWKRGMIGTSEWQRYESMICRQIDRVNRSSILREEIESTLTLEFIDYSDSLCERSL